MLEFPLIYIFQVIFLYTLYSQACKISIFYQAHFLMQDEVSLTKTTVNRRSMAKLLIAELALVNNHDCISKRAG